MTKKRHHLCGNQNASKGHNSHLNMRCKKLSKELWKKQSERENLDLTAWIEKTLNAALMETA